MTPRARMEAVYRNTTPDEVPWFADLSNWLVAEKKTRFVPAGSSHMSDEEIALHKELGVGAYLNMGAFWKGIYCDDSVKEAAGAEGDLFTWTIATPIGTIQEERRWSPISYSWDITRRMLRTPEDMAILRYAFERKHFEPDFAHYQTIQDKLGDYGFIYASTGYCGIGFFVSRFMGVANTYYALADRKEDVEHTFEVINAMRIRELEVMCDSPCPVIFLSDNLSSGTIPPPVFQTYAAQFYRKTAQMAHAKGKFLSIHVDGTMKGLLPLLSACGVDCIDAVTPAPMGDLTPSQIREQSGNMVLCGGISAPAWLGGSEEEFDRCVKNWLDLKAHSPRLIVAPGDQVPPGTDIERIRRVGKLTAQYGRFA
ncbi:MAG: uroporphyrinogen decarboxylase family protein [Candidatus Latescibacterota bacterium]